jgi:hypothetical protein
MAELPFAFGGPRDFDILTDVTGEMPLTDAAHDDVPQASSLDAAGTPVVLTTTDVRRSPVQGGNGRFGLREPVRSCTSGRS